MLACANAVYRGEFPIAACLKSLAWFDDSELVDLTAKDRHQLETNALTVEEIPTVTASGGRIGHRDLEPPMQADVGG